MMNSLDEFIPEPIDDNVSNEWALYLDTGNGLETVSNPARLVLRNDARGIAVLFGKRPGGNYSAPWRVGGGGAATVLWTRDDPGELYIGVLTQLRALYRTDSPVENIVRGYKEVAEDMLSAAMREAREESGQDSLMTPVPLPGQPVVMDTAWFAETRAYPGSVQFYGLHVPFRVLVRLDENTLRFAADALTPAQRYEDIFGVHFVRDQGQFEESFDAFTIIGYARLRKYLRGLASPNPERDESQGL